MLQCNKQKHGFCTFILQFSAILLCTDTSQLSSVICFIIKKWILNEQSQTNLASSICTQGTDVSGEQWKKAWYRITWSHHGSFSALCEGRSLNLGCGNCSYVLWSLFLSVSIHKESKTGEANHRVLNRPDQANKWQRIVDWAVGWTKGQIPTTFFLILETYTCHQEKKRIYFVF